MKFALPVTILSCLALSACATPIAHLALPTPSTIQGTVTEADKGGFTLRDSSGDIDVDTGDIKIKPPIKVGENLTVRGVVDEDDSEGEAVAVVEEMDAFEIIRADGTVIQIVPIR
jgi:hypothetical protein